MHELAITPLTAALFIVGGLVALGVLMYVVARWINQSLAQASKDLRAMPAVGDSGVHPRPKPAPAPVTPKCDNCKHFDLEAGRATMEQWPAFALATRYRTPAQMYNNADHPDAIPVTAKWTDFGACDAHNEVRFAGDVCAKFEPKEQA